MLACSQTETGKASYYADKFHGRTTASGEKYNKRAFTAAHKKHPFGTILRVTRVDDGRSVVVKVNDRGPFSKGRIIDLSGAAAQKIDMLKEGVIKVKVEVITKAAADDEKQDDAAEANMEEDKEQEDAKEEVAASRGKLYEMQAKSVEAEGFAIQIASFADYANVLQMLNELGTKGVKNMMIHASEKDGKSLFRLLVGKWTSKKVAEVEQKKLASKKIKGFILDLRNL